MGVTIKDCISKILKGIDEALEERGYESCNKENAHIILDFEAEYCNITLNVKKR